MKISLLQPKIERGNIESNINSIQQLIDKSRGELLVLPEYAFTGSLTLESNADINKWTVETDLVKKKLNLPEGKILLVNSIVKIEDTFYNCCEFLPFDMKQIKVYPDDIEKMRGIKAGKEHETFHMFNKRFKVLICMDLKYWSSIKTNGEDFILFIFHFTKENYESRIMELKAFIKDRNIPVLASSLVSDKNNGFSTYMDKDRIISLSDSDGILEVEL